MTSQRISYEALLLQQRTLREAIRSRRCNNNGRGNNDDDAASTSSLSKVSTSSSLCASSIGLRASMVGMLTCVADAHVNKAFGSTDSSTATTGTTTIADMDLLSSLLDQSIQELDREASDVDHVTMEAEAALDRDAQSTVSHMLQCRFRDVIKSPRIAIENNGGEADVDAFFDNYPECAVPLLSSTGNSDLEEDENHYSSDEGKDERMFHRRSLKQQKTADSHTTKNIQSAAERRGGNDNTNLNSSGGPFVNHSVARGDHQLPEQKMSEHTSPTNHRVSDASTGRHTNTEQSVKWNNRQNPSGHFQHGFSINGRASLEMGGKGHNITSKQPQNSSFEANKQGNTRTWNDYSTSTSYASSTLHTRTKDEQTPRSVDNPFRTAREYAELDGDCNAIHVDNDEEEEHSSRTCNSFTYNSAYPYNRSSAISRVGSGAGGGLYRADDHRHGHVCGVNGVGRTPLDGSSQNCIRGPNISAGLKRKFQPPKRNNDAGQDRNRQMVGQYSRHSTSSSGGGTAYRPSSSHSNRSNSDDEELPEALRGLDKELIEKIQNEIVDSGESVTFDDIAGLADVKQTVQELVCWPMKRPDLFTGLRRGPNGLLLFGPPGTGKTLVGKAIAHESGATFFSISSSSLTSKWIGEGEKLVRTLFAVAAYREPAVVFIDEIDSLLTQRKADENEASRRIKTEFLVQLDGTGTSGQGRVLVIGATNRPHELDDAARRRFVKRLYIPLPARADREVLLRTLLSKNSHSLCDKEMAKLSADTDGFSGADLKALCTDAALGPIRQLGPRALEIDPRDVPPISYRHFRQALRGMKPSVAQADLDVYVEWNRTFGNTGMMALCDDGRSDEEKEENSNEGGI